MIHVPAPDPFAVFALPRALELDERALERKYLQLSRECHPDHNRAADTADCAAVLQRSAEINDAWRVLRDRWARARALLEAESPGVLERNKKLDPAFLVTALELAEEVANSRAEQVPALRERLRAALAADFDAVRDAIAAGDLDDAARRFHGAHYHRKALADLEARQ
ncbi:MAG: Fe-S protein assembly co-chaperone HscB [Planctomycetes bacterium]|nr:Fe-S protein assembly co-chaperone HscB [Planctomycetota bacterium]